MTGTGIGTNTKEQVTRSAADIWENLLAGILLLLRQAFVGGDEIPFEIVSLQVAAPR